MMTCVLGVLSFNISEICRICLRKEKHLSSIYSVKENGDPTVANLIVSFGNTPVYETDGLPAQICEECDEKIQVCYKFRQNIQRTFEILCRTVSGDLKSEENDLSASIEDVPIKKEEFSDSDDDRNDPSFQEDEEILIGSVAPKLRSKKIIARKKVKTAKKEAKTKKIVKITPVGGQDKITAALQKLHRNRDKCPLCLQKLGKDESMAEHFYSHYISSDLTPLIVNGKKTKTCNLCNKTLRYNTMVPHHRIHLKVYPFKCSVEGCDKGFISSQYLAVHADQHTGVKKFQCQACGKTFGLRSSLKNHEETHIFEHAECKLCHKKYKNTIMLRVHMKRHNNGLKFKCEEPGCDKAFYLVQELNRHLRMHAGPKSHVCDICSKAWYTPGELERHKRYHATVREHQCTHCMKTFVEKTQLRLHEMAHRGDRPHVCEFCTTTFVTRSKLKRHQIKSCKGAKEFIG